MTAPRDPKKPYANPAELGGLEPALPELSDEGWDFDGAALDAALSQAPASGDGRPKASRSTQPLSFDRSLDEDDGRPSPPPAFLPIQTAKFVRHDDEDPQVLPPPSPIQEAPGAAELMSLLDAPAPPHAAAPAAPPTAPPLPQAGPAVTGLEILGPQAGPAVTGLEPLGPQAGPAVPKSEPPAPLAGPAVPKSEPLGPQAGPSAPSLEPSAQEARTASLLDESPASSDEPQGPDEPQGSVEGAVPVAMSDKTILGRYQILDVLGRGAFSIVYRAVQIGVGRTVALKVFLLHPASTPDAKLAEAALVRFQREARLASQLRHPNTVTLYDYDRTDASILYMAFEYVEGPTLSRVIKDAPQGLSPARAIQIARQVALSLQEAHSQGIIHRDLKPGNIMLTRRQGQGDYVKVLDFGIAKVLGDSEEFDPQGRTDRTDDIAVLDLTGLGREEQAELTQDGRIVGTPRYIPPEQIHGSALSPAADLYALGLILHEMLTGVPANPGRKPQDLIKWHLEDQPFAVPAGFQFPAGLAHIIQKATRKAPTERYASCEAFLEELDRLDERGEWRKEQGRSKLLPVAIALNVVMLLALAVALYFVVQGERGPSQPNAALVPSTQPTASPAKPTPTPEATPAPDVGAPEVGVQDAPSALDAGVAQADAAPDAPAPLPAARTLEITSDPAGAEVWLGDLMLGQTPVEIALEDQPREMGLTLRKKGYQARTVTWRPNEASSPFPVVLKRAANEGGGGGNGNKYRIVP